MDKDTHNETPKSEIQSGTKTKKAGGNKSKSKNARSIPSSSPSPPPTSSIPSSIMMDSSTTLATTTTATETMVQSFQTLEISVSESSENIDSCSNSSSFDNGQEEHHSNQNEYNDEQQSNEENNHNTNHRQDTNPQETDIVSLGDERQLLILVLLAQVTALNDWTPNTFYAHLNDFVQKGLIDYELIMQKPPSPAASIFQQMGLFGSFAIHNSSSQNNENDNNENGNRANSIALVPYYRQPSPTANRMPTFTTNASSAAAASAAALGPLSVKDYPLIMSRYKREFIQKRLLASGAFGHVYQVTNKLDHCDYAIKRVIFTTNPTRTATGHCSHSTDEINCVIREIQCLAQLNHENVVRYYTSWLEPSWTMVSEENDIGGNEYRIGGNGGGGRRNCLLTNGDLEENDVSSAIKNQRSFSISTEGSIGSDYSEWTIDQQSSSSRMNDNNSWESKNDDDDNFGASTSFENHNHVKRSTPNVKYQICMNIQTELCAPTTLADWIRKRNNTIISTNPVDEYKQYRYTWKIFHQIAKGLSHVHSKNILHRDLKPANILYTTDGKFKIADFGLSRKLKMLNGGMDFDHSNLSDPMIVRVDKEEQRGDEKGKWNDPMTSGIGTGSYASPEQLETQFYGPEADIFSLGMILLELFCKFGSAHERAATFHDCRKGKLPNTLAGDNPFLEKIGSLILICTEKDRWKRPTAMDIVRADTFNEEKLSQLREIEMEKLHNKLTKCQDELGEKDAIIRGKDDIIQNLKEELRLAKGVIMSKSIK